MGVSVYFYIEVKDKDGKWHLVKWYSSREFDEDPDPQWDQERIVEIDGVKAIEKWETCPGLRCRDELSHGRYWSSGVKGTDGLPDDISDELSQILVNEHEKDVINRIKLYGDNNLPMFGSKYGYFLMSDLFKQCDKGKNEWIENVKKKIRDVQLEEITDHLQRIEDKIDGKKVKKAKKKDEEYLDYEDTLEYQFDDALWDMLGLYQEATEVMEKAIMFTGNRWLDDSKVRIVYYFN